jgi:NodT family efflux transporter outer membrane factor (OMF) lipoprotein
LILIRRVVTPDEAVVSASAADAEKPFVVEMTRMRRMGQSVSSSNTKRKKVAIMLAIACSFLLVLPSCIPHLRHPEQGPKLPDTFMGADDPENVAQLTIEDFFNDPTLTTLVHQAVFGNLELRVLAEEVQIASNEILARTGAYQPSISPAGSIGMNRYSQFSLPGAGIRDDPYFNGKFLPNPLPEFTLGLLAIWTPDIWWQLHNARDAAGMRYFAAGEGRKYVVTTVVAEIADNYFGLLALDKRLENLDMIIALQEQSLRFAQLKFGAGQGTDLAVQRFLAEVRRNQSEKLIVQQDIIQTENRINFLAGRYPQPVARPSGPSLDEFIELNLHALSIGMPAQLLQLRPDVRRAERNLAANGLDVVVARKNFYPRGFITAGVGYDAFNPTYLFMTPQALVGQAVGNMLLPLINRKGIKADYFTANARQLQALYDYQRTLLNAFTEVVTRTAKVQNYLRSIEIKKQQVKALERSVDDATKLYQSGVSGIEYIDVLFAQRDLFDARRVLIDTKREQLSAIVNTYQALGGGAYLTPPVVSQALQHLNKKHFWHHLWHHKDDKAVPPGGGPVPPPAPPGEGPVPPPAPPDAVNHPTSPPGPKAATDLEPLPGPPASGGLQPPPAPPADGPPIPPPRPAAEMNREPLPAPPAERASIPPPTPGGGRG